MFPVPGTCSWKVPLFLVGSVFPYSRGNKEGKKEPLFLAIFEVFFLQFYTYFGGIKARKLGKKSWKLKFLICKFLHPDYLFQLAFKLFPYKRTIIISFP